MSRQLWTRLSYGPALIHSDFSIRILSTCLRQFKSILYLRLPRQDVSGVAIMRKEFHAARALAIAAELLARAHRQSADSPRVPGRAARRGWASISAHSARQIPDA